MPPILLLRRAPLSYFVALLISGAALWLKLVFEPLIGSVTPFLLFFGAIMFSAWNGGRGPGLLAVFCTTLGAIYYFLPPLYAWHLDFPTGTRAALFLFEGTLVAILTAQLRSYARKLSGQVRRQTALTQISGAALAANEPHALFEAALDAAQTALRTSHATIFQLENGERPLFRVRAERGWREMRAGDTLPGGENSQLTASVCENRPFAIYDTHSETQFDVPPEIATEVGACLVAPIGRGARAWGVLAVHHNQKRFWTQDDADFLGAAANTLAVALERESARQNVHEGEARYRAFLEQSTEAIWRFEFENPIPLSLPVETALEHIWRDCFLAECNAVFAQMYGFSAPEDVIGARLGQLMPADDPQNIAYLSAVWSNGGKLSNIESHELDKHGQPHVFVNNLVGIVEDGALVRVWGTQRDVTQERESQKLIQESERRFRRLFEGSPLPTTITRNGQILFVNQALVEMMGFGSPEDFVGKSSLDFLSGEFRPLMTQLIAARGRGQSEAHSYEVEGLRRDGTRVPLRVEIAPLELPDGPATMVFAFDLTEEKANAREIATSLKRQQRAAVRAIRLQEISLALSQAMPPADLAHVAINRAMDALGASAGVIMTPDEKCQNLRILSHEGYPQQVIEEKMVYGIEEHYPIMAAFRDSQPLWISDLEVWTEQFPALVQIARTTGTRAIAAVPLAVEGKNVGVLGLSFPQVRQFDEEQRAFLATLAGLIAGTLERARLDQNAREAARKQQESLALFNALLASAPVGFALFDERCRYQLVNEAAVEMHPQGLSREEHLGRSPVEMGFVHAAEIEAVIRGVWETQTPTPGSEFIFGEGDKKRHLLVTFFPVQVENGPMLGVGVAVLEITERVRAQNERDVLFEQLETERARFEAILQQLPSAVIIGDAPSGQLILGNPQVERIMGQKYFAASDVEQYHEYKGFKLSGEPMQSHEWPLARAIRGGEIVQGEEILVPHDDGSTGVIRVNAAPIRDKEGHITAGVVVIDDITARARQNATQQFLAEVGAILLSTLDEGEAFQKLAQSCVPRVADWCIVAIPGGDGLLHQAAIAHADSSKATTAARFQNALALDPQTPWDIHGAMQSQRAVLYPSHALEDLRKIHASDEYMHLIGLIGVQSAIVAPLVARGRIVGVMIWLTAESGRRFDETDLAFADELAKRAATSADNARLLFEAQQARDQAQTANRAKDEFLAVVSHELRTPLTPILGWLDILRSGENDETLRNRAYDVIERNAKAQSQLVNDILDVSRITTGKLRLELKEHAIAPLVERAVESLKPLLIEKGVCLETEISDIGIVRADAARLQQIVWNLLSNALKFTPSGGLIRVRLQKTSDNQAHISIQDSGVGIAPEFLPHVFDRFRQADSSSTRKAGGLGLGLAIVRHLADLHDGQVAAHSDGLGQGATFSLTLPLLAPTSKVRISADIAPPLAPLSLEGQRILLVDDERDTRDTLALLLQSVGAVVQIAESGAHALELAIEFAPTVIVSDIGMPEMDGFELRAHLRDLLPEVPALALSAYATQGDVQKAKDAGFQKHLSKPVGLEELSRGIVELVV